MLDTQLLAFVRSSIPSLWALDLLLLLRRAAPRGLARDEMVQLLRATPTLIDRLVVEFTVAGLVSQDDAGFCHFDCTTAEKESLCEALALAAKERPIAVRDAILSAPNSRLRDLANAFRFGDNDKTPKGGQGK